MSFWDFLFKKKKAPVTPVVAPSYSPALIEKYAWKPGRGTYPGLSGSSHQRRMTRRAKRVQP
jgi:hypothetical protein